MKKYLVLITLGMVCVMAKKGFSQENYMPSYRIVGDLNFASFSLGGNSFTTSVDTSTGIEYSQRKTFGMFTGSSTIANSQIRNTVKLGYSKTVHQLTTGTKKEEFNHQEINFLAKTSIPISSNHIRLDAVAFIQAQPKTEPFDKNFVHSQFLLEMMTYRSNVIPGSIVYFRLGGYYERVGGKQRIRPQFGLEIKTNWMYAKVNLYQHYIAVVSLSSISRLVLSSNQISGNSFLHRTSIGASLNLDRFGTYRRGDLIENYSFKKKNSTKDLRLFIRCRALEEQNLIVQIGVGKMLKPKLFVNSGQPLENVFKGKSSMSYHFKVSYGIFEKLKVNKVDRNKDF